MDSIESELLSKLVNAFSFNFKKNYQDLAKSEFLDVYKLLLQCYDESWVLNTEQPDQKSLKQIQGYLKILELGHLIARDAKFDELIDPKRNARLLGGLISKLESRYPGAKLQGVIRKIRLVKPKSQPSKRTQRQKNYSSSSSAEEELKEKELVVPIKGKEIPRTPPVGGETELNREEFLKPKPAKSPRTRALNAGTAAASKNFQPILPTKEIPRTPLKGAPQLPTPTGDVSVFGHNPDLTVDFSASRLPSSNTSTPYEERPSSPNSQCDATFVVPPKLSADLLGAVTSPTEETDNITPETRAIRRGTYVKQTSTEVEQQDLKKMSDSEQDSLKLEAEDLDDQNQPDAQASPEIPETKKRGGRQPKNVGAKSNDKLEQMASEVTNTKPDSTDAPAAPTAKGKKGRGKKAAAQVADAPEPETNDNKKRGKKGKNNAQPEPEASIPEEPAQTAVPVAEIQEPEAKDNKKRGKKGKNNAQPEPEASVSEEPIPESVPSEEPTKEDSAPEESVPVEPAPEVKGKKGRGKAVPKAAAAKVTPKEPALVAEKPSESEEHVEEPAEAPKPDVAVPEVADAKAKKGRGKKAKAEDVPVAAEPIPDKEPSTPEVMETAKTGRKAATKVAPEPTRKSSRNKTEPAKPSEELEQSHEAEPVGEPEAKKRSRGKIAKADAKVEEQAPAEEKKKPVRKNKKAGEVAEEPGSKAAEPAAPKGKRNNKRNDPKGGAQVTAEEEEERNVAAKSPERPLRAVNNSDNEVLSPSKRKQAEDDSAAAADDAPPEKKKRGRAVKKDTVQSAQSENQPPATEEAPAKKGAKKGKEVFSETEKKKTTGRKKAADTRDDEADETTSPTKPKRAAKTTPQVNKAAKNEGDSVFVNIIAGQQSADPSPVAPPPAKGRRLKMVQDTTAASAEPEAPEEAPAAPAKRGGRARKAK